MSDLFIIDHPLVQSKLALLRDKNTNNKEFSKTCKRSFWSFSI